MIVTPRNQPPVQDRPEKPERFSVTWLDRFQSCPHSAYLAIKYGGGATSAAMDRGSAFHAVAARLITEAMEQEDQFDGELAKAALAEVLAEGKYTVPSEHWDWLRVCCWHFGEFFQVDYDSILGIEQLMVLDLGDFRVSMRVDLAAVADNDKRMVVTDWKTQRSIPTQESFNGSLQTVAYALGLAFGRPVNIDPEGNEQVEPYPLGQGAEYFTVREIYPGILFDDPTRLASRERTLTRSELLDERLMLEALVAAAGNAFLTGEFPAIPGDRQCSRCPCRKDCPLPEQILPFAGSIETPEDAQHFAYSRALLAQESKDVNAALKAYIEDHGPIPLSDSVSLSLKTTQSVELNRKKLEADIEEAPIADLEPYRKEKSSTRLAEEGSAALAVAASDLDAKWGETLPV